MDYEEKYKTALQRVSLLYKDGILNENLIDVFPELIELENERIKRKVIKEICLYVLDCDEKDKMLDWLKKQKPIEWSKNDEIFFSKFNALCESCQLDFANGSAMYKDFEKMKNWLKSLKQRII